MLRRSGGRSLPPTEESVIRAAIAETLASEPAGRNLDAFWSLLRGRIHAGDDLVARLEKWVRRHQLGWLFNNAEDRLSFARISGFDMTRVLDDPTMRTIMGTNDQIKTLTNQVLKAMTGDRTGPAGQLASSALGRGFNVGQAPNLGQILSSGNMSWGVMAGGGAIGSGTGLSSCCVWERSDGGASF